MAELGARSANEGKGVGRIVGSGSERQQRGAKLGGDGRGWTRTGKNEQMTFAVAEALS